jgi:putative serine protease PepD
VRCSGSGASAGILAVTGAFARDGSPTTTVVQASSSTGGLSAGALYAAAAPGVVDITAEGSSSGGKATGTGFVVDSEGHVVTASHVVDGASKVTVRFASGATRTCDRDREGRRDRRRGAEGSTRPA